MVETESNHTQTKAGSGWKNFLLVGGVSLFVLILAVFVATIVLEDKLKAMAVEEVNKQVTVPIKVNGGIGLSFFKHFPYASITFNDVSIDDKLRKGNKKLISVNEISFLCNIYSVFGDEIEFSKVVVRRGELNLYRNEAGKSNFDILKGGDGKGATVSVKLKKLQIKDVDLSYVDKTQNAFVDGRVKSILLAGNFAEKMFNLDTKGDFYVNKIVTRGDELLSKRNLSVEMEMEVDQVRKKYNFSKGKVSVEETQFNISGFLVALKNETKLKFKLLSEGKDIQKLFSLLPAKYKQSLADAEGSGQYAINALVKGVLGKNATPSVNVSLDLKDSELKLGAYNKLLKNINASAKYELDEKGKDKIVVSNFNCTLNDQPFNFKLSLSNLSNPDFDFFANGVLYLSEIALFIPDSVIQDIDGHIKFNNFHLTGRRSDFYQVEGSTMTGSGEFNLSEVEFRQNGITYGNINGLLKYQNESIEATGLTLNLLGTDFNFTGTIDRLLPFAYNLDAKRKSNDVVLGVNGKIKMQTFNLSGILDAYSKKNRPRAQAKEKINIREILSMKGNVDIDIGRFVFRKMQFDNLKANLQLVPGFIRVNHLSTSAMGGELRSTGLITFTNSNALNLKLDVRAVQLNIPKIFAECEDFGQTVLTGKNLKGTISTAVSLDATWKDYKALDTKTLSAIVDFQIKNGELIKFEPLRAASKFIKLEELEDIRFADLENTIKIANSRFDVPEFEIKSSALNLMLFGTHTFDNIVDYHFKINLHKLLAQKFTRKRQDIEYIENDPYEGLNLYLTMTGNLSNPDIKFDKARTRNKIQADFRNEKTVLKELLKSSSRKVDNPEQKREDKYFDLREEPQFMDFDTL